MTNQLTSRQKFELKRRLLHQKQMVKEQLQQNHDFGLFNSSRDSTGDLSTNDNHPGDLGTEMFERSKDLALNETREIELDNIEQALRRMEDGTYGRCTVCGKIIPYERLEAMPTASTCVQHVPDSHINDRRPLEEETLLYSLSDARRDAVGAWEQVKSWGTASSTDMSDDDPGADDLDLSDGCVESIESFLATDIYGEHPTIIRNQAYEDYVDEYDENGLL